MRLLLVFPNLTKGEQAALVAGGPLQGALYFPLAASRTRVLRAGQEEHFVSVLIPKEAHMDPAALASSISTSASETGMHVSLQLPLGGRVVITVQLGGGKKEDNWRVQRPSPALKAADGATNLKRLTGVYSE